MKPFHLDIVTPDGSVFDGEAESLLVRTKDGDVEILAGHTDLIGAIGTGRARIISDGKSRLASVSGGFITVRHGEVKLVATTFEFADEIDLERAKRARDAAEKALSRAQNEREERIARAKISRASSRISVAEKK